MGITLHNQVDIKVQKKEETDAEFTERLNNWLVNHKNNPILMCATASSDGRQTLNFAYRIALKDKE